MREHQHDHGQGHQHGSADDAGLAELLDLDGEVLPGYWNAALGWVRQTAPAARRIVDLGAGTGVGSVALARCFPGAEVIAVDSSAQMLERVRNKAAHLGLADRIRTVEADLDEAWPDVTDVGIIWASLSLHHLLDPDRVLAALLTAIAPGGVLAVAEFGERLRFLPDELGIGRPGLEERCLDALAAEQAHSLPEVGSDWAARLAAAGFEDVTERVFRIELGPPLAATGVRYARRWLDRLRTGLGDRLDAEDQATLDALLGDGPQALEQRDDLRVRGSRVVVLGRRPSTR
jgi:SAM-dependent methyltransferase